MDRAEALKLFEKAYDANKQNQGKTWGDYWAARKIFLDEFNQKKKFNDYWYQQEQNMPKKETWTEHWRRKNEVKKEWNKIALRAKM